MYFHRLQFQCKLRIDLEFRGFNRYDVYDTFYVGNETDFYRLLVANYIDGAAWGTLRQHSGAPFSTYDQDNDETSGENCAARYQSGWWFDGCSISANLNGNWSTGVVWTSLSEDGGSITFTEMKLKRN